ncbi:hypothetical protein ACFS7Z_07015 [Pontibacter toksunensis]|uniref:Type I restriction enzyme S subunit n=1 Tax=Pontibacter toksunensis TaxID=1332631 RepID=A0ABW6BQK5_9BACT
MFSKNLDMQSNYKPLGKYIKQVNTRNEGLSVSLLKGININKEVMPSVANTNGTDLTKYKIVERGQFAYNPMHVGRDEVLPISLLQADERVIVSPAYTVFEVIDEGELLPEYLMMWCRRSEFDRNVWFTTDNSVRGGFSWDSLCEMQLPVPHIDEQREIVKEYNIIVNHIKLNEQLIQKLEETAQSIYKQWFVDFEFPDENGQPYKSSGGEMLYNSELDKEIPKGWKACKWGKISSLEYGKGLRSYQNGKGGVPVYGTNGQVGWTTRPLVDSEGIIIGRKGVYRGVHFSNLPFYVIDTAFFLLPKVELNLKWAYYEILHLNLDELESGSAIPSTSRDDFYDLISAVPSKELQDSFAKVMTTLFSTKFLMEEQNNTLQNLSVLLLSKISKAANVEKAEVL